MVNQGLALHQAQISLFKELKCLHQATHQTAEVDLSMQGDPQTQGLVLVVT